MLFVREYLTISTRHNNFYTFQHEQLNNAYSAWIEGAVMVNMVNDDTVVSEFEL